MTFYRLRKNIILLKLHKEAGSNFNHQRNAKLLIKEGFEPVIGSLNSVSELMKSTKMFLLSLLARTAIVNLILSVSNPLIYNCKSVYGRFTNFNHL